MSQKSRPAADISNTGWTPAANYYLRLNEEPPNDGTFVYSSNDPQGDTFLVKLADLAWPHPGVQRMTVRARKNGPSSARATIMLLQGAQSIVGRNVLLTDSFSNYSLELTEEQTLAITDYTDLRLRVTAGYGIQTTCCTNKFPEILRGTFTNKSGAFTVLPDSAVFLWNGIQWQWFFTAPGAHRDNLAVACNGSSCSDLKLFAGATFYGPAGQSPDASPQCSCSNYSWVYTVSGTFGYGTGGYNLTMSED